MKLSVLERDELRKNIRTGFTVANFFLFASFIFYAGFWKGGAEKIMQNNSTKNVELQKLIIEQNEKIEEQAKTFRLLYVPRTEIQGQLDMMINMMKEMKEDIKDNRH